MDVAIKPVQAPEVHLATRKVVLGGESRAVTVENRGDGDAFFTLRGCAHEKHRACTQGAPSDGAQDACPMPVVPWLTVVPICGRVPAHGALDIIIAVNRAAPSFPALAADRALQVRSRA